MGNGTSGSRLGQATHARRAGERRLAGGESAPGWRGAMSSSPPDVRSVPAVTTQTELRIEPPAEILAAAREWLQPVREALGAEFLSAYLTGSVLTQGFDPE